MKRRHTSISPRFCPNRIQVTRTESGRDLAAPPKQPPPPETHQSTTKSQIDHRIHPKTLFQEKKEVSQNETKNAAGSYRPAGPTRLASTSVNGAAHPIPRGLRSNAVRRELESTPPSPLRFQIWDAPIFQMLLQRAISVSPFAYWLLVVSSVRAGVEWTVEGSDGGSGRIWAVNFVGNRLTCPRQQILNANGWEAGHSQIQRALYLFSSLFWNLGTGRLGVWNNR